MNDGIGHGKVAEIVRLGVPGALDYVRVVRLTAAAVATSLGLDVEDIDDLRVAVDELASAMIQAGTGGQASFTFSSLGGAFVVEGTSAAENTPRLDEVARQILAAVVDDFDTSASAGFAHFRAVKQPTPIE